MGIIPAGVKGKRAQIMKNKITEDYLLYEESENEVENVDFSAHDDKDSDDESSEDNFKGPHGEIYPDSSSGEELIEDEKGN